MLRKLELQKLINMSRIFYIWIAFLMGMISNRLGDEKTNIEFLYWILLVGLVVEVFISDEMGKRLKKENNIR